MILALCGHGGSGKDSVAQIIVEQHGFVQVAFADVLKRFLQEVFCFSDEQLWGPSENRDLQDHRYPREFYSRPAAGDDWVPHCLTPRKGLTILGDALRECYPNAVVDYGIRIADRLITRPDGFEGYAYNPKHSLYPAGKRFRGVVFSDARLWRELERVRDTGGKLVRVLRPGGELDGEAGEHLTESEMDRIPDSEFHHVLNNDGTLDDLRDKVAQMMASV